MAAGLRCVGGAQRAAGGHTLAAQGAEEGLRIVRVVVTEYPVWNVWIQRPFDLGGYAWMPYGGMAGYAELTRQLLASPEDVRTITVTHTAPAGTPPEPASLWDSGGRLDDFLLLLSLGQGRSVHWRQATWELRDGETVVEKGVQPNATNRTMAHGERAISPFEVEPFLRAALEIISQPGWSQRTGFVPAVYWYLESISSPVLDVRYLAAWHGLEVLARRDQGTQEAPEEAQALVEMVLRFRSEHGWDFMTDDAISRWAELYADVALRRPDDRIFPPRHAYLLTRKLQLSLLLVLLELVGTQDFARRDSVLRDIRR